MPGVGNDVVDLKEPDNRGKSRDARFLARVFTADERGVIARAAAPDTLLWALWAAKEAAYKAVSGGDRSVCSIPHRYPVHLDTSAPLENCDPQNLQRALPGSDFQRSHPSGDAEGCLTGRVITPRGEMALCVTVTEDYVHALATGADADFAGILQRVDRMDEAGSSGDPSAFVRGQLLAEISRRFCCPIEDLAVLADSSGSGAPRVLVRDRPLDVDISLSHDGRFAAFVLLFRAISAPDTGCHRCRDVITPAK